MAAIGQWNIGGINLPDFGITEALGIGQANPFVTGNYLSANAPAGFNPSVSQQGQILNQQPVTAPQSVPGVTQPKTTTTTPTNTGGGGSNPPVQQQPSGPSFEDQLNAIYNPILDTLNNAQNTLQTNYGLSQNDINNQYQNSASALSQQNQQGLSQINQQEQQAGATKEDAVTAAVRLYNELVRGGQQRFGRGSDLGQAYQALTGNELQRNQGAIQKQFSNTIQQINTYKQNLNDKYTQALQDLETQKNTALTQAQQQFNDQLASINSQKATAASAKAQQQAQALQDLRNQVNSINLQNLQFKQQLAAQQQASVASVDAYTQQVINSLTGGNQALNSLSANTSLNPTSGLAINTLNTAQAVTPTGAITNNRKTDIYGNPIA